MLAASPDYPAALALLGIVSAMKSDLDRGVELMRKAISLRPGIPSWVRASRLDVPQHLPHGRS